MSSIIRAPAAGAALLGCASVYNAPLNVPMNGKFVKKKIESEDPVALGDLLIGLVLGLLHAGCRLSFWRDRFLVHRAAGSILDRVDFTSGVSGGSVTAAYHGLKKRAALTDFRERFLLQNAEEGLMTTPSLRTVPAFARRTAKMANPV